MTMNPHQQSSSSALLNGNNNGYLVSMRNTPSNINTIKTHNDNQCIPQNKLGLSSNTSEFDMVKEEKEILSKKLDDFTKILGEFQNN